jgi:hypothetical protein
MKSDSYHSSFKSSNLPNCKDMFIASLDCSQLLHHMVVPCGQTGSIHKDVPAGTHTCMHPLTHPHPHPHTHTHTHTHTHADREREREREGGERGRERGGGERHRGMP